MKKKKHCISDITMDALRFIESKGRLEDNISIEVFTIRNYLNTKYGKETISDYIIKFVQDKLNFIVTDDTLNGKIVVVEASLNTMSDILLFALSMNNRFDIDNIQEIDHEYKSIDDEFDSLYRVGEYEECKKDRYKLVSNEIRNIRIGLGSYNYKLFLSLNLTYGRDLITKGNIFGYGTNITIGYDDEKEQILAILAKPIYDYDPINVFDED